MTSVSVKCDKENQRPDPMAEPSDDDGQEEVAMSPSNRNADEAIGEALLEKLRTLAAKPQDNVDTFRVIVAKIHARVTSSDRRTRERMLEKLCRKNSSVMEVFITALENCKDHIANCSIASILHECISCRIVKGKTRGSKNKNTNNNTNTRQTNGRTIVTQLINLGITQVLIKLLINAVHSESTTVETLIEETLWILAQVIQRDQKFVPKMKSPESIRMFHLLLKQRYNNGKSLLPLLVIIKTLAKNSFSLQVLAKDGIANTFEKTFVYVGYTPQVKLKTLLETFKYFTTSRLCCVKFVKVGLVHLLMRIFERWEKFNGPIKLKICSNTLSTLQHICAIKAGRKIIRSNNGLQLLHRFCANCPEDKAYDCLLSRVCGIINQCLEKQELPVPEMSPARFVLPETNVRINSAESGSDVDSQTNSASSLGKPYSDFESGDEEENSDSRGLNEGVDEMDENKFFAGVFTSQRSERDLIGYHVFLEELGNLSTQLDLARTSSEETFDPADQTKRESEINGPPVRAIQSKQTPSKALDCVAEELSRPRMICGAMKVLEEMSSCRDDSERQAYRIAASRTSSLIGFRKMAYPDVVGGGWCRRDAEPLNDKDRKVCRQKLLTCMERGLRAASVTTQQRVAYDLDALIVATGQDVSHDPQEARAVGNGLLSCNCDEKRLGKRDGDDSKLLRFESRFESGNLRKAIQIGLREYDLILTPDVNSGSRHQWFYFEVSNMEGNVPYTFNIINCEKPNSQFNFGMKPILFSVAEAQLGRAGWVRTGVDICYYRNCYQRPGKGKHYLTTSFTVTFPHAHDVCYLAYHFPYTYSRLMVDVWKWSRRAALANVHFRAQALCETLNGNQCPLITVTAPDSKSNPLHLRKIIFLTSRVHPGESNASWIMHGTLEALLSDSTYAASLRDDYIFKIVPMLNIEGVVNGCNRYGLTNEDLNRRWSQPSRVLHPVIYHTKGLMEYCARVLRRPPHVFVDYHGHSRRKNVFLFGCSRSGSWSAADRAKPDQPVQYLMLPYLMQKTSPAFALPLCSFKVERNKESTARVAIWRQLGVSRSYTMESSFCGCDQGALAGLHLDTKHLKAIGEDFCRALSMLKNAGNDWNIEKCAIPMGQGIPEESTCMDGEASSTCDTDESDDSEMPAVNFS